MDIGKREIKLLAKIRSHVRQSLRYMTIEGYRAIYMAQGYAEKAREIKRVQFVLLHQIKDCETNNFRKLLKELNRDFRFISYSEAVNRVSQGDIDGQYMTFSVDDGLRSGYRIAQALDEFSAKACFFVCGSMLDSSADEKKKFAFSRLNCVESEFLDRAEIEELLSHGHELGSHTLNHALISSLSEQQICDEISGSYELLRKAFGPVRHFAWPYGRFSHFSAHGAKVVFDSGFESCASGERGCHVGGSQSVQKLCVRRDNIMASWPIRQSKFFLNRNAVSPLLQNNLWPEGWRVE